MTKGTLYQRGVEYLRATYIIEVDGDQRYVADYIGDEWLPTGCEYDPWQYDNESHEIRMLAIIVPETLELVIL
jgi:hypothetical protein